MSFSITVLATGSTGNAIVIDGAIMIDLGLSWSRLTPSISHVSTVLISHRHNDHLNLSALSQLSKRRPGLLSHALWVNTDTRDYLRRQRPDIEASMFTAPVSTTWEQTITSTNGQRYNISAFPLDHDVENYGFVISNEHGDRLIHATDTASLQYAPPGPYDCVLIEGNYEQDLLNARPGKHGQRSRNLQHLSVQDFEYFVRRNTLPGALIVQLHESARFGSTSRFGVSYRFGAAIRWEGS